MRDRRSIGLILPDGHVQAGGQRGLFFLDVLVDGIRNFECILFADAKTFTCTAG